MVLEIKYVNANNAVIHTENLVTGILAKISLGPGIWAKFRLGTGIWYPPSRPSQRLVRVKTRTKAFFFEEILINIRSENLPQLSKERMQYFCHALKLNLRRRHSATRLASIVR